ncbi:MAG: DUF2071 domain-containing protein [Deinococcus sp.]|nr:DUF2071 domain-containing protein [Deinococcus sp.]
MHYTSALAAWAAHWAYRLPYCHAHIDLKQQGQTIVYSSRRTHRRVPPAEFSATWTIGQVLPQTEPGSLAFFLTERYCLYAAHQDQLYRSRIFHQPWQLYQAELVSFHSTMLESHGLPTPEGDPLLYYAEAMAVQIWLLAKV